MSFYGDGQTKRPTTLMVMETRPSPPKLPEIAESEQTTLVRSLLQVIADLQAQVRRLEDEIRRLQGGPPARS